MSQCEPVRAQPTVRVTLEVTSGPHEGASFEFQQHDTFLVGRGTWSHLCLRDDIHFSRHHFRVEIRPPDCYLLDLGSRNGTFVNGIRVNATFLRDGDVISGGKTQIRVHVADLRQSAPPSSPTVLGGLTSTVTYTSKQPPSSDVSLGGLPEVPGYELLDELGVGAMGVVYSATHRATGQAVAIKLITQRQSTSERAVQLFIREASLMGRLDHPNIVHCLDFGYAAGQLFLVMEYVPTISLETVMTDQSKSGRVRIPCGIICQVLKALEHAHGQSVVHRDIKPENVLLFRRDYKLNAKLADFGLAKNCAYAGLSEISREGDIRGTIAYMPPELVVDCRHARPTGDIYSVGATLYFYLSGCYPFEFGTRNKLSVVLDDDPVPISERVPDLPSELAKIIHRSLEKEPANRFSSAREMHTALIPFAKRHRSGRER